MQSVYCHWEYYSSKEKEPIFAKREPLKRKQEEKEDHCTFFSLDTQVSGRLSKIEKILEM